MLSYGSFLIGTIFMVLCGYPSLGKGTYHVLLNKTYAERYYLLDSFFYNKTFWAQDSNSAYTVAKEVIELGKSAKDKDLILEGEMIRLSYYFNGKQPRRNLYATHLNQFYQRVSKEKPGYLCIRVEYLLAVLNSAVLNKYQVAFRYYLSYYNRLKNLSATEFPNKKGMIASVGAAYYNFGDYVDAKKYLLEADAIPSNRREETDYHISNTLGLIARDTRKYDTAIQYFEKANRLALEKNDLNFSAVTQGNIGITLYYQKRYVEAIPLLEIDVQESFLENEYDNGINSLLKLAAIYVELDSFAKANQLIDSVNGMMLYAKKRYKHLVQLYYLQGRLYSKWGDMATAYMYADSARIARDSFDERTNAFLLTRANHEVDEMFHIAALENLRLEKKIDLERRNSMIIGLMLLFTIAILVISRQRILYKNRKKQMQTDKKLADAKYANAILQLDSYNERLRNKREKIQDSNSEIARLNKLLEAGGTDPDNEVLQNLLEHTILTDEEWHDYKKLFEQIHPGYIARLKHSMPELSPAEFRYILLSKLKLSNKEMAALLGIRPDAIRLYRHRIKKKFNLSDDVNIEKLADLI